MEAEGGVLWALYDDFRPALVFGRGSGVEWEPVDGGAVPGEDGVEGLCFGVAGDLGCDGAAVLVVQHFWEEADGGALGRRSWGSPMMRACLSWKRGKMGFMPIHFGSLTSWEKPTAASCSV